MIVIKQKQGVLHFAALFPPYCTETDTGNWVNEIEITTLLDSCFWLPRLLLLLYYPTIIESATVFFYLMLVSLCSVEIRNMNESASCTDVSAPLSVHRRAVTLNNLVAGCCLPTDESKQGKADRIQMFLCSGLHASHTDNTVYIINHLTKLISRRWNLETLSVNLMPDIWHRQ